MKIIDLDARDWKTPLDFYDSLLAAVGAPDWHGRSPDALNDSMIWGGINALEPPFMVRISRVAGASRELRASIETAQWILREGRKEYQERKGCDIEVAIEILS